MKIMGLKNLIHRWTAPAQAENPFKGTATPPAEIAPETKRPKHGAASNFFDGHQRSDFWKPEPTVLYSADTEQELTRDREEMMAVARQICQVFGLGNRVLRTYANYTVGSNLQVDWHTADTAWNEKMEEIFKAKSKMLDVRGMETFTGMARLAVIHTLRDGDVGFVKVNNPGFPMLDPIEADRIGPFILFGGRQDLFGGVRYDKKTSRPLGFNIANRTRYSQFVEPREILAKDFIHVFDTLRFDGHRGMSAFAYGALGRSRSIKGLVRSEEVGVTIANKWAAFKKTTIANAAQEGIDLTDDTPTGATDGLGGTAQGGQASTGPKLEQLYDGMIERLLPNEDIVFPSNNRPSPAWQGFLDFLIHDFAIALDLPFEFVWSMAGLTGPAVRLTSKQAERTFDAMWMNLNDRFFIPVISWVTSDAIANGEIGPNDEFWKFQVQRPAHPSIDAGRDSNANVAEYGAKLTTGSDIAAESGRNIFRIQRQLGREYQHAQAIAKEFGCPVDYILQPPQMPKQNGTGGATQTGNTDSLTEAQPGQEPPPQKKKANEKKPVR